MVHGSGEGFALDQTMLPAALKLALCGSGAQRHGARVASRWYTTLDADTHDDFKPKITSNAVPTDAADVIKNDISSYDVFLYMKGVPKQPQCGFSNNVVRLLDAYGVQYGSRNVLADPSIREGVKKFSNWPTIPQACTFTGTCRPCCLPPWACAPKHPFQHSVRACCHLQVYVKGEFVGGADILWSMHESGELEKLLEPIVAKQQQAGHK
ncbi:hypothetical protein QJQ45_025773 [Haematococcus lacustris]|nr:hypothetical protein QJQ45_025773 [Haematococcus lacustris]